MLKNAKHNRLSAIWLMAVLAIFATSVAKAAEGQPDAYVPDYANPMLVTALSNNGEWGVSESTTEDEEGLSHPTGGTLIDVKSRKVIPINSLNGYAGVSDVADDATVVGEFNGVPAFWSSKRDMWTSLPLPDGFGGGRLNAVTPDAKFAVGYINYPDDMWSFEPVIYDLTTKERLLAENLPLLDMAHLNQKQNAFTGISADGRYVLGIMSQSYLLPVSCFCYVYDRETASYNVIGFKENNLRPWTPAVPGLLFIEYAQMSPSGEWVTGAAYMAKEIAGSLFPNEYRVAYRYHVSTDEFEIYDGVSDSDIAGFSVTDDGVVLAATPAVNPYSTMMVRSGKHYYSLDMIFDQCYGFRLSDKIGSVGDVTGKPVSVTSDGLTIAMLTSTTESYILTMPEPLAEAAKRVNLMASYTTSPVAGSVMSRITDLTVKFDRPIVMMDEASAIKIYGEDGEALRNGTALQVRIDGSSAVISFRTIALEAGKRYELRIPDGMFAMIDDTAMKNRAITVTYEGRESGPVKVIGLYPADGADVPFLDNSTSYISLAYNATLKVVEGATAALYRKGDTRAECTLYVTVDGQQMYVAPSTTHYLYDGTDYEVVIPEGVVTDLSGGGANEELRLEYHGTYVRQWSPDDMYLFRDDATSYDNFMWYDGDGLTPASKPEEWGFFAGLPWCITRQSEDDVDMAFASHSMYTPAGKSDDWMVTPQIFIPDANCYLAFDAQSYKRVAKDRLKVYVYVCETVYSTLTAEIIDDIRENGILVFDELLNPGLGEERLDGEWQHNVIDLSAYEGKGIYIAFLNDNENQSAVFVDNIEVVHNMKFFTSLTNPTRVVDRSSLTISGTLSVQTPTEVYTSLSMTLTDGNGKTIDTIEKTDLNLAQGDVFSFQFANELPLASGVANPFTVSITLNDDHIIISDEVLNLVFEPTKRVVIEEFNGSDCGNCPMGIVGMENLERLYPGRVIPVSLRCYNGDVLGNGVYNYASAIGLNGAPTARINRGLSITAPMVVNNGDYMFSSASLIEQGIESNPTWLDVVREEFAVPAIADIDFSVEYDDWTQELTIPCVFRPAIGSASSNVMLLAIVLENELETYQLNYLSTVSDPDLGEWANGGKYASYGVYPVFANDVARGVIGQTISGTPGLIPSVLVGGEEYSTEIISTMPSNVENVDNCEVVVMAIDGYTGHVINANKAKVGGSSGIEAVIATSDITFNATTDAVTVNTTGDVTLEVYTIQGLLVGRSSGNGVATVALNGYRGITVVKGVNSQGVKSAKLMIE